MYLSHIQYKLWCFLSSGNQTTIRREGIDGIIVTGPGKLNCKYIFHVLLQGSVNGWKGVISSCLQLAEKLRVTSVAFPALGTGITSCFDLKLSRTSRIPVWYTIQTRLSYDAAQFPIVLCLLTYLSGLFLCFNMFIENVCIIFPITGHRGLLN